MKSSPGSSSQTVIYGKLHIQFQVVKIPAVHLLLRNLVGTKVILKRLAVSSQRITAVILVYQLWIVTPACYGYREKAQRHSN